jgi:replicative DNA helicase
VNVEQIKENISVVDVLDKYLGVQLPMRGNKSRNIPCPIHGGHNDNFAVDVEKNIATCFSKCGRSWSVIDLTMEIHRIDFKGAVSLLEKDFELNDTNTPKTKRKAPVSVTAPTNAIKKFNNLYKTLTQDDYFLNRGLSKEIIEKYGLGAVTEQTELNCIEQDKHKKMLKMYYRYIIPISDSFLIARLDENKGEGNRYFNIGQAELLNKNYIGDMSKTFIFVTEGAIDALTIETLGYNAIALNSAANASLLVKEIQLNEEKARQQQFILLADNDKAGKELEEKLQNSFKMMNMNIFTAKLNEQYKDINELVSSNPDEAENTLQTAVDECINGHSAYNVLFDLFNNIQKVNPIQITEFPRLNEVIGGLRTGLYVIGAASSLGKTTFIQEIADDVASQGEHVLFFSLEMGKKELIAKSLVRTMGELKRVMKMPGEITYTRDLLDGNIKNYDIYTAAVGHYERTAKNLFIYEGMFDMNVLTIKQEIEKHIRLHNKKPLVIVDYLQVLEPLSDRMSEKQATDKNVTELKRLTRESDIPLIAISSFNRDGYNKEASFSAFKESGSIEYGSDVVLALELQKIKELEKDANGKAKEAEKLNEAKGSLVRDINLKVLKNRFGKSFEEIEYSYVTTMNKFMEKNSLGVVVQDKEKKRI